jgi:hypothetical protein
MEDKVREKKIDTDYETTLWYHAVLLQSTKNKMNIATILEHIHSDTRSITTRPKWMEFWETGKPS